MYVLSKITGSLEYFDQLAVQYNLIGQSVFSRRCETQL